MSNDEVTGFVTQKPWPILYASSKQFLLTDTGTSTALFSKSQTKNLVINSAGTGTSEILLTFQGEILVL
jgi:hypothetical protein